jgi:hypothetical protein
MQHCPVEVGYCIAAQRFIFLAPLDEKYAVLLQSYIGNTTP